MQMFASFGRKWTLCKFLGIETEFLPWTISSYTQVAALFLVRLFVHVHTLVFGDVQNRCMSYHAILVYIADNRKPIHIQAKKSWQFPDEKRFWDCYETMPPSIAWLWKSALQLISWIVTGDVPTNDTIVEGLVLLSVQVFSLSVICSWHFMDIDQPHFLS
jgi:hypothetical protein